MSATPAAAAPQARGTLGEFTPDPHQRVNAYKKVQQSLGAQDRIALVITGAIGTMYARLRVRAHPRRLDDLADGLAARAPSTRSRSPSCFSSATSSSCC